MENDFNAILGLAFNLDEKKLSPFLNSLDRSGFKGELILFVNNRNFKPDSNRYGYTVTPVNVERKYRLGLAFQQMIRKTKKVKLDSLYRIWTRRSLAKARKLLERSRPFPPLLTSFFYTDAHISMSRIVFYYNHLLTHQYNNVFFTDISDVIFQDDLFRDVQEGVTYAFLEDDSVILGQEENNSDWIMQGYGKDVLALLSDKPVHCSGTILADHTASIRFLKDFVSEICNENMPRNLVGMDQGIFNYLISAKKLNYFKITGNGQNVFTAGAVRKEKISIKDDKIYYPEAGDDVPAVVHQYNRHPVLLELVDRLY